ncbi:diacylglycerol kinase epsilon-like [Aricia agestis]|uniref:diacylglycerol kinase epsilon-like n=1 Tax=Aricia agestis TaxID=91739 RepID=UPI001C20A679|nr:diacylglycerol kinase epsilon-like [Aricia agestis]
MWPSNKPFHHLWVNANRKSGSYKGDEVLSIFRGVLNPIQVIDIASIPPEKALKWLPTKCKILVAGGDGTIAWVLNALHGSTRVKACVGILPMGTGNDLSRSLGWGPGNTDLDAHAIISNLLRADEILLDRWKVTIKPKRTRLGRCRERVLYSYNYTSVGVDAQVALDFHRARSQFLYRYANRTLNYMAYAVLGAGRVLDAGWCDALERRLRVWTGAGGGASGAGGGVQLDLPPLQALVLLNITCWGAGVRLWGA